MRDIPDRLKGPVHPMAINLHGRYRVGVDIGGTFTDLIVVDDETGSLAVGKVLTTPGDPS